MSVMNAPNLLLFLSWACLGASAKNNTNDTVENTVTFDLDTGEPGSFSVGYTTSTGEGSSRSSQITVAAAGMTEIDAQGNLVASSGGGAAIPTFSSQTFESTTPEVATLGSNSSVQATKVSTKTVVPGVGTLQMDFFSIESAGLVGPDDGWNVSKGDSKINVLLSEWNFSSVAAFIDLDMNLSEGTNVITELQTHTFDLGGSVLSLTDKVTVDGTDTTMPSGYPKIVSKNGGQLFTFRFPRFNTSLVYDPAIQPKREEVNDGSSTTTDDSSTTTGGTTTTDDDDDGFVFDLGSYPSCTVSTFLLGAFASLSIEWR